MLPVCAALLLTPLVGRGGEPTETVIRVTAKPAAEPKPALRYRLLPDLPEMQPGNPVQEYMKCFMEQNHFFFKPEEVEQREKWLAMPLKELPVAALRNYGGIALTRADYAARLELADWQTLIPLRRDGLYLLIPEVQQMRRLTLALRVRMRGEVADGRMDDAITTVKTLLALSRHLDEHPTLIGSLVGIAIASITLEGIDEMVAQPGCPNLYWALTALPAPLMTLRKGAQGERVVTAELVRSIDTKAVMSEAQINIAVKAAGELHRLAHEGKKPSWDLQEWLSGRVGDAAGMAAARKRLVESGLAADTVQQFPPMQVILVDEKLLLESDRDAAEKLLGLPYWQAQPLMPARPADPIKTVYGELVPAYHRVLQAQARLQQRVNLLRCVEGLRLYAAAHGGKLPASLADVPVPQPVDPMTGKAFGYTLKDGTATVRGTPPVGLEKAAGYNVRYEMTIAK
jgi:hypothetical protein